MPYCTACGNRNPDDARFCAQCGTRLVQPDPGPAAESRPAPAESLEESTATIQVGRDLTETGERPLAPADAAAVDALPPGHALLVVQRGPGSGSRFLLDADVVRAGRHPDSEIFLDDVTVSRRHAEFTRTAEGFSVADSGSLNGTYVNRDRIDSVRLSDGDEVQIGKFRLVFFSSHEGD